MATALSSIRPYGILLVITSILAGCSGDDAQHDRVASSPYYAEIVELSESSDDPFVQEITDDGALTEAEYAQLQRRYVSCMHGRGFTEFEILRNQITGQPIYQSPTSEGPDLGAALDACAEKVELAEVEALYNSMSANPHKEDIYELWARCLRAVEAVDANFDARDMREAHNEQRDLTLGVPNPENVDNCLASPHRTLDHVGRD